MLEKLLISLLKKQIDKVDVAALCVEIINEKIHDFDPEAFAQRVVEGVGPGLRETMEATALAILERLAMDEEPTGSAAVPIV